MSSAVQLLYGVKDGLSVLYRAGLIGEVLWDVSTATYDNVSFSIAAEDTLALGLFFKPDGTKMYIVGNSSDAVHQYTLSTAWDVSTAVYDNVSFPTTTGNHELFFKPDGTRMYVVEAPNLHQYDLSTPWDLSTAVYNNINLDVTAQDTAATGVFFKPDGLKMYMAGSLSDAVHQYTLSTAWDISTAIYDNVSFNILSQGGGSEGIFFKPDGKQLFMLDSSSNAVHQYTLTTAWNLSTASYDNISKDISGQDFFSTAVQFKPDGTKMYMLGRSNGRVFQYTLGGVTFPIFTAPTDAWAEITSLNEPPAQRIDAPNQRDTLDITAKPDGTRYFYLTSSGVIYQNDMSTPWDLSTSFNEVSFTPTINIGQTLTAFTTSTDGQRFYIATEVDVYQYTLSTAWDISTASNDSVTLSGGVFGEQRIEIRSIQPSYNGDFLFIMDGNDLYRYELITPWDLSSNDGGTFISSGDTNTRSMFIKPDATRFLISIEFGPNFQGIEQYNSTVSYSDITTTVGGDVTKPFTFTNFTDYWSFNGMYRSDDGTHMLMASSNATNGSKTGGELYHFTLPSA